MLATISLDSLLTMINTSPDVTRIIQLPVLCNTPSDRLIKRLRENSPTLDTTVAAAIGDSVQLLGLNASSSVEELSAMIGELIAGFAISRSPSMLDGVTLMLIRIIEIDQHDASGWLRLAGFFAHSFTVKSLRPISIKTQLLLRQS
jgi:hypothetical protein